MSTEDVELLGSYWTLAGGAQPHTDKDYSPFDFKDRVESAARAGFTGIGLWHTDITLTLQKRSLREMKQILDDNGIRHVELEFLTDWFLDGEPKKRSDVTRQLLLTAAEALGARHIKVGDFVATECPMPRMIESFAELCADAANHGTRILFEMMPFCKINSVESALALVEGAGAENGGVIFDLWHIVKGKIAYDKIAGFPLKYLLGVELNDGTFEAPWSLHEDTIHHRRFCGEGEFDVKGFVAAVQKAGYRGPWGIEVLNEELRRKPLEEAVSRAFQTTIAQFR